MKKTVLLLIITFGLLEALMAQEGQIPERIFITDKFFSPWGTNLFYKYKLELNGDYYTIQRTALEENGKKKNRKKQVGKVKKQLIQKILFEIEHQPNNEIQSSDFQVEFSLDSIKTFLKTQGDNYWINNDYQKQFIIEQLTEPHKLKNNLELYFNEYDHSGYIDGSSTEVNIEFHFVDSTLSINSKSILWFGLPIEINGEKFFSPKLSSLLGELIPESKTERKEQFKGEKFFTAVITETIGNQRSTIDNLESKTYQVYLDSLKKKFNVSDACIAGSYSVNWDGERRLSCQLTDSLMMKNLSILYSNPIENDKVKFPVSNVIKISDELVGQLFRVEFLKRYLTSNPNRKAYIIYDGNGSYSDKTKKNVSKYCEKLTVNIDFNESLFLEIEDEYGNNSRWLVLPNGQYVIWWYDGTKPQTDNSLKCE